MEADSKTISERMWGELLPFVKGALAEADEEFAEITFEEIFNRLYGREAQLDLKTRELCIIAFLTALGKPQELDVHLMVAFNLGWSYAEVREVMIFCALASGWPAAIDGMRKLKDWCEKNNRQTAPGDPLRKGYAERDWLVEGERTGAALFGAETWNRYHADIAAVDQNLAGFMTENFIAKFLTRSGLDARTRQLALVAAFAAVKSTQHLRLHVYGALNSGVRQAEIKEILFQVGIYAGQEAMSHGLAVYRSVIRMEG